MFHSGENAHAWETLKDVITKKLARLGHFPPASQAGCLAGPVFYVYVFSLRPPPGQLAYTFVIHILPMSHT